MLQVNSGYSQALDVATAIKEMKQQISRTDIQFILFFVSKSYDFHAVTKAMRQAFPLTELIGCTTAGELSSHGFTDNSIVALGIAADHFTTASTVIRNIHAVPMLHRKETENTFKKTGLNPTDPTCSQTGFGLLLMDGLQGAEEKVLSVVNSIIKVPNFQLIGGSAGDGLDFKQSYVCLNGEVYTDAAVVTFVKTDKKFYIHKEDIFHTTGKSLTVTKADIRQRRVYELDGRPAAKMYAETLGVPRDKLTSCFMSHPLGRRIVNKVWTSAPFQLMDDDSITFSSQIFPGTLVDILQPEDPLAKVRETIQTVRAKVPKVQTTLAVNCLLRTLQFKEQHQSEAICAELAKLGHMIGFSSIGEQWGKMHLNQTLLLLALGE